LSEVLTVRSPTSKTPRRPPARHGDISVLMAEKKRDRSLLERLPG